MSRIVGIGANVFDTLIQVPYFPAEDTKLAGSQDYPLRRGTLRDWVGGRVKAWGGLCLYWELCR